MTTFANIVTLRGFLGADATVPPSDGITEDAYAVLLLATVSGIWYLSANEWTPRTDWHRVICPGPWFCGFTRGMRRGEYLEIEGELRAREQEHGVVVAGERFPVSRGIYAVHAIHIRKLERPLVAVNTSEDG
jgi:hypothetical protein